MKEQMFDSNGNYVYTWKFVFLYFVSVKKQKYKDMRIIMWYL